MPEFTYKVKIAGRTLKKKIEAPTKESAIKMVRGKTGVDLNTVKTKSGGQPACAGNLITEKDIKSQGIIALVFHF